MHSINLESHIWNEWKTLKQPVTKNEFFAMGEGTKIVEVWRVDSLRKAGHMTSFVGQ